MELPKLYYMKLKQENQSFIWNDTSIWFKTLGLDTMPDLQMIFSNALSWKNIIWFIVHWSWFSTTCHQCCFFCLMATNHCLNQFCLTSTFGVTKPQWVNHHKHEFNFYIFALYVRIIFSSTALCCSNINPLIIDHATWPHWNSETLICF